MTDDDRVRRGMEALDALQGEGTAARMMDALARVDPGFARFAIGASYGEVGDRPGLSPRDRQLVTIAALAAMGGCEPQLERHVLAGLRAGLTREEIVETCVQIAVYAGHPRANNAFRVAGEVLRRRGLLADGDADGA